MSLEADQCKGNWGVQCSIQRGVENKGLFLKDTGLQGISTGWLGHCI